MKQPTLVWPTLKPPASSWEDTEGPEPVSHSSGWWLSCPHTPPAEEHLKACDHHTNSLPLLHDPQDSLLVAFILLLQKSLLLKSLCLSLVTHCPGARVLSCFWNKNFIFSTLRWPLEGGRHTFCSEHPSCPAVPGTKLSDAESHSSFWLLP